MVETDLQSAIGGLSEEGRSNAGVCVCVRCGGGGRGGGIKKSPGVAQQPTSQLLSQRVQHRLKVILRVLQNPKTTFTLPHNADVM